MTILVGLIKDGDAVLASDRRVTWGGFCLNGEPKCHRLGAALVGRAGAARYLAAIQSAEPLVVAEGGLTLEAARAWVLGFADHVRAWGTARGHGSTSDHHSHQDAYMVVVTTVGVWEIDGDGGAILLPGGFGVQGSGASYAAGALHAAQALKPDMAARDLAQLVCEAAVRFNNGCGGPVDVLELP